MNHRYDVIVIGGGHAGIEASLAAERMGCRVALITFRIGRIGEMSCNPAIGGIAKGTIVREVDALDGSMAKAADRTRLQFRMLNRRKGPAVWGPRVQSDASAYASVQRTTLLDSRIEVIEDEVTELMGESEKIEGVICRKNGPITGRTVVIAAGTFLKGRLFRGEESWSGGRSGDISADSLEKDLRRRMFHVERFKTGTPARVLKSSVDLSKLNVQEDERSEFRFSFEKSELSGEHRCCYTVETNQKTSDAVRKYMNKSPLLQGRIEGTGPRYCPSFEDKVVKFPEKKSQRIYVEPMGTGSRLFYLNGLSTSLPREAQELMVRSLPGFDDAVIVEYGYAVEYSYFRHTEFDGTLRLQRTDNVFIAGQICGTSGYEEAAGLGLIAGANAALKSKGEDAKILSRMDSYIGVMIDDISNTGLEEPYRMFSSRAENRLHIRQDNADRRLYETANQLGVFSERKRELIDGRMNESEAVRTLLQKSKEGGSTLSELCRRPEIGVEWLLEKCDELREHDEDVLMSVMLDEKYRGYIERNKRRHQARERADEIRLDGISSYMEIEEVCWEAREVLEREKPDTLRQASRLPGVRPTDLQGIIIHLSRKCSTWNSHGRQ